MSGNGGCSPSQPSVAAARVRGGLFFSCHPGGACFVEQRRRVAVISIQNFLLGPVVINTHAAGTLFSDY